MSNKSQLSNNPHVIILDDTIIAGNFKLLHCECFTGQLNFICDPMLIESSQTGAYI